MKGPAHMAFGLTSVGLVGSIMDESLFDRPEYLIAVGVAALLPDVDHPRAPIGMMFYPLSKLISKHFSHRTITHSLIAILVVWTSTALARILTGIDLVFWVVGGYISHIVLDMMTVQGVALFYPFKKNPCVVPGNPNYRFRSNNSNHEILIFSFSLVALLFMKPLIDNGFWSTYNTGLSGIKHLESEFRRSDNLIELDMSAKGYGGVESDYSGYVMYMKGNQLMLKSDSLVTLDLATMIVTDLNFRRTDLVLTDL